MPDSWRTGRIVVAGPIPVGLVAEDELAPVPDMLWTRLEQLPHLIPRDRHEVRWIPAP